MTDKCRITIASSSEQLQVAERIKAAIDSPKEEWDVHVWDQLFDFSDTFIESLEEELEHADFAVVVLTGDDPAKVREQSVVLPRDNALFELGLFIGRLGRSRCFFFVDASSATRLPSDLLGVHSAVFYPDAAAKDPRKPTLEAQVERVKNQLRRLPVRYKPSKEIREQQEALWRFSQRVAGHWWERMRDGEDDQSALSYLTIAVEPGTNTLQLEGQAYGLAGEHVAVWRSRIGRIALGGKPTISYFWKGHRLGSRGQELAGEGELTFDEGERLESGGGHFYDTNYSTIRDGTAPTREKNYRLKRCSADDVAIMEKPTSAEAFALVNERVRSLSWR